MENQSLLLRQIYDYYQTHNQCVAFIHGKPNTGKSITGMFAAIKYESKYYNTFNPTAIFENIEDVYFQIYASKNKPGIIQIDEIDVLLDKIMNGQVVSINGQISITNKSEWNTFLDNIQNGMYPYTIFIFTSNKSRDGYESMLRDNRINICHTFD